MPATIFNGKVGFFGMAKRNPEVVPVTFAAFAACCAATYCLVRSATRPDVVWSGKQAEPWNRVNQSTNFKFPAYSHHKITTALGAEGVDLRGKM